MANKMVSQLLLVALAVPQVICTNTSQSDYASFDEHVQKDCFKGGQGGQFKMLKILRIFEVFLGFLVKY